MHLGNVDSGKSGHPARQSPTSQPCSAVFQPSMSANLCVEAHMRELLEQGYEVAVVKDVTAAAQTPE